MHPRPTHERAPSSRWALPLDEHPRLEVEGNFVLLVLVPVAPGEAPFAELVDHDDRVRAHPGAPPPVTVRAADGTTRVNVDGSASRGGPHGEADAWQRRMFMKRRWRKHTMIEVVLHVPSDVRGHVHASAAQVVAQRLTRCDLAVAVDAGALVVEDVSGRLDLATNAGRIGAHRIRGSLRVSANASAVHLEILSLDDGKHEIKTSMGAIHVGLADGMPVQIDTKTALGSTRVDARSTRGAPAVLDLEADLGAIRVVTLGERWRAPAAPEGAPPPDAQPYRTAAERTGGDDGEVERILARVADGSLSPEAARELLRAMGWG